MIYTNADRHSTLMLQVDSWNNPGTVGLSITGSASIATSDPQITLERSQVEMLIAQLQYILTPSRVVYTLYDGGNLIESFNTAAEAAGVIEKKVIEGRQRGAFYIITKLIK